MRSHSKDEPRNITKDEVKGRVNVVRNAVLEYKNHNIGNIQRKNATARRFVRPSKRLEKRQVYQRLPGLVSHLDSVQVLSRSLIWGNQDAQARTIFM